jgi:hypothetical protein
MPDRSALKNEFDMSFHVINTVINTIINCRALLLKVASKNIYHEEHEGHEENLGITG